ncbi:hypothetical protein HZA44_01380 [Candidatus Peregrinibacteria bacterium]|nr:hypothetical protein [Candidatus Peregrinibacteria bacterium]
MARYTVEHRGQRYEVDLGADQVKLAKAGFLLVRAGRRTIRVALATVEMPEEPIEVDMELYEGVADASRPAPSWFRP